MKLPADIIKAIDIGTEHLSSDVVAAYIDGALSADERRVAGLHLSICATCSEEIAILVEAVKADIANPARIDDFVKRLTAIATPPTKPKVALPNIDLIYRDGLRSVANYAHDWIGTLASWTPRPAAVGVPMRAGTSPKTSRYVGFEISLEKLFTREVLVGELAWAKGTLSITAAYDGKDRISDLRAAIGCDESSVTGVPIILRIGSEVTTEVTLTLTQDRPAIVVTNPPLKGTLTDMEVSVCVSKSK